MLSIGGGSLKAAGAHALDAAKTGYGSKPMTGGQLHGRGGIFPFIGSLLFALYRLVLLYASFMPASHTHIS